jgi:exodeoxyribonuclease V alpha subunit
VANIAQTAASEALAGLVERVTFHNPENGFCVLRVKARGHRDLVTVVGRAALISAGEFIQMCGTLVNDRTYGQRFRWMITIRPAQRDYWYLCQQLSRRHGGPAAH